MPRSYDDLSKEELIALLKARDRRDATRFGLVWETNEVERDRALNGDKPPREPSSPWTACQNHRKY